MGKPKELERQSGNLNINIEDGVDFAMSVIYKIGGTPVDVTGYTATFTIKDEKDHTVLLTITEITGIAVGTTDGKFGIPISDTQAVFGNRNMVYDFVVKSPSGIDTRLLRGDCVSWVGVE